MSAMVVSEIDMGDGGPADAGTQAGDAGTASAAYTPPAPTQPQGDRQAGAQPPPAEPQVTAEEAPKSLSDEEIEKLDLGESENIRQFRNTYQKNKELRAEAEQQRDAYKQELEDFRSKQGQGVYLNTDVPFEDFNPYDGLQKMATEEPEYHDAVVDAVLQAHLWPNLASEVSKLEGKQLGRLENGAHVFDNDEERMQYQQIQGVWDFLSRRSAGIPGPMLSAMISVVGSSPEIRQAIESKLGMSGAPAQQGVQQQGYDGGVPSLEAIARHHGWDLSDPDHLRWAQAQRATIGQAVAIQAQFGNALSVRDAQLRQMQEKLQKVEGGQQQASTTSAQEAEQRAESRVAEHLRTALDTEFQEKYAGAIPKDRPNLGNIIKTQTREQLAEHPQFKEVHPLAKKWLKQAVTATEQAQRQKYEEKGLGALAVVATLRSNIMADVAKELLGKLPAQVAAARAKMVDAKGRRELPGGTTAQTVPAKIPPAQPGDIEGMRAAVRARMKQQGIRMS